MSFIHFNKGTITIDFRYCYLFPPFYHRQFLLSFIIKFNSLAFVSKINAWSKSFSKENLKTGVIRRRNPTVFRKLRCSQAPASVGKKVSYSTV